MDCTQKLNVWDPLVYLNQTELCRIDEQFESVLRNITCLVFWTGLNQPLVQHWADQNGLMTLVGAMGPLFLPQNPKSARTGKTEKGWSKYMKGASGRFAEYACRDRRGVVVTNPPPNI